ncbi:hypothetical protein XA68_15065 [Ophiocordyceps unilateralis]|uniref:Uncharacterized protein n=1 Tax=Ophiocordyceps unilateralis TaxID=268505 RepID=A0A2A9PLK8_OPHUN|nr:hypothetical protein XA68_15065 [Ophiocordyceps unilateralis]
MCDSGRLLERRFRLARLQGRDLLWESGVQRSPESLAAFSTANGLNPGRTPQTSVTSLNGQYSLATGFEDGQRGAPDSRNADQSFAARGFSAQLSIELNSYAVQMETAQDQSCHGSILDKDDAYWNSLVGPDDVNMAQILGQNAVKRPLSDQGDGEGDDEGAGLEEGQQRPRKMQRV